VTKLSKHFSSEEFSCPCGKCEAKRISPILIEKLQILRGWVGEPIFISKGGGMRCKKYNDRICGYNKSPHLSGKAADISCKNTDIYKLATMAKLIGFKRIGLYPASHFIHVDIIKPSPSTCWMRDITGAYKYFKPPKTLKNAIEFCKKLPYG